MKPRLLVLAAAILFSTGGAAIKGTALNAWQVAGMRSLIAAVLILAALPESRRGWRLSYVPVAMAYAVTLMLFVAANKLTTAADAIFLQGAAPIFVLMFSPVLLGERIRRGDAVLIAAVVCGMGLFFAANEDVRVTAPDPVRGNLLAGASALTYALMIAGLRWIARGGSGSGGLAAAAIGNLLTAAIALPLGLPFTSFEARDAAMVAWLGVFQVGLAYICLTRGIRAVPAVEATALLMADPALSPVWAWLAHGERPSALSIAGGAVILTSILVNAWWQARFALVR